jgi:FKBP-type peptidyl-prolyl cis-trans isomerase
MLRAALLLCSCALACGSNAVGEKFLEENKNKEGVITLASGMQYKVLRQGDGESLTSARPHTASP